MSRYLPACALSLLLLAPVAGAQALNSPTTAGQEAARSETDGKRAEEAKKELEKNALALLEETLAETQGLKLVENRVRLQATAAGLLWSYDETRARALFQEMMASVVALNGSIDPEDPQSVNAAQSVTQLRSELLQTVAQYDPKLALDFLRATRQPRPRPDYGTEYKAPDQETMLEMNLASQIASRDPEQALRIAQENLRKGVTSSLVNLLYQLATKNPEAATKLASDIIKSLRSADLLRDYEASNVAVQLLSLTRVDETTASGASQTSARSDSGGTGGGAQMNLRVSASSGNTIAIDERSRRDLLELVASAALSSGANNREGVANTLISVLQSLMPEVEKYAPTRVAALRRRATEFERTLDPRSRMWREYQSLLQQGNFDAVLDAAAKAPPEIRDQLYSEAAWRAFGSEGPERARQIAEKITNTGQRAEVIRNMERQIPWRAAAAGDLEAARQRLASLTTVEERAPVLAQMAGVALSKGDKQVARQLLEEARAMLNGRVANLMAFNAQLQVARVYASLDSDKSFEMIESAIDRLNELVAAAAVLDGFGTDSFKDGELKPQGGYMWNDLIGRCADELAVLARSDFERARNDIRRFQRVDTRTTAQMRLIRGLLTNAAPPGRFNGPRRGPTINTGGN